MAEISRGFFVIAGPCSGGVTGVDPPQKKVYTKISGSTFLRRRWTCAAWECYCNTV